MTPALTALLSEQDGVASVTQLRTDGVGRNSVCHRVQIRRWQWLLPGVVLAGSGEPTRRQKVIAAWLWAGADSAIDGASACFWYGLRHNTFDPTRVHVVVPYGSAARTQAFVVVRRTISDIVIGTRTSVPYVDPATAVIVAARGTANTRSAIALLSTALQTGLSTLGDLQAARERLGDKWCRDVDGALVAVGVGLRSPAERDAHDLIVSSRALPTPLWNQWLDLGDGQGPVCVDALWVEAAMVHETNGRRYHAWGNAFEDMQARHDRMTAAGLIVLHNSPARIRRKGPLVVAELERTHARYAGQGLPPGVRLLDAPHDCGLRAL
jgi:hypothetical protein